MTGSLATATDGPTTGSLDTATGPTTGSLDTATGPTTGSSGPTR